MSQFCGSRAVLIKRSAVTSAAMAVEASVTMLTDANGDGKMDKATVFADKLVLPRLLLPLDGRVLIGETYKDQLYSYRDTNRDGVVDGAQFLEGGIAAADHRDLMAPEEEPVAGRAGGDAVPEQAFLGRESEHPGLGAGSDDHRAGDDLLPGGPDRERRSGEVDVLGVGGDELGAETFGLLPEAGHEVGSENPFGEPGEVLHLGGEHELTTGGEPFDHDRSQVGASGVDGRGQTGRPGTDDHHVTHVCCSAHRWVGVRGSVASSRTHRPR